MLRIEFVGNDAVFIRDHIERRPRTKTVLVVKKNNNESSDF